MVFLAFNHERKGAKRTIKIAPLKHVKGNVRRVELPIWNRNLEEAYRNPFCQTQNIGIYSF